MTIANSSTALAADLSGLITAPLATMQTDAAQLPLQWQHNVHFQGLVSGVAAHRTKQIFVMADDAWLETMAVIASDMVGSVTLSVSADGLTLPASVTFTAATGISKATRLLFDNTKTSSKIALADQRTMRLFARGTTVTVTATTASVVAASRLSAYLCFRTFFARGA